MYGYKVDISECCFFEREVDRGYAACRPVDPDHDWTGYLVWLYMREFAYDRHGTVGVRDSGGADRPENQPLDGPMPVSSHNQHLS
ncbi:hypothetical protein E143388_06958 [Rhodococcus opacus]|nr:hypothetical protein E143388_06958 [Rhodococcus opacus]